MPRELEESMGDSNKKNSLKYLNFQKWVGFGVITSQEDLSDLSKVTQRDERGVQSISSAFLCEMTITTETYISFICLPTLSHLIIPTTL